MTGGSEIEKMVAAILADVSASGSKELDAWHHPERDIRSLAQRDYAPNLHQQLGRTAVEEIIRAARHVLPGLNQDHDPQLVERWLTGASSSGLELLFSRVVNRLDIHFQGAPFTGPEGFALRGFFVSRNDESLQRPLIYVNTAHHPVAAAATLFHEVGHLVASEVFDQRRREVQFFFDADYIAHLNDVEELSADIVLSLVAYPAPIAKKIFRTPWNWGALTRSTELSDEAFCQVSEYFRARFGVRLAAADLPARRKLNYLAGMIHFAKLRSTVLAEYGI
jgi:hypothetical protein